MRSRPQLLRMRQASKLTEKLEQRKKELAEETVEARPATAGSRSSPPAPVTSGRSRSPEVLQAGDVEMMEDLIAGVNAALTQAREPSERELGRSPAA